MKRSNTFTFVAGLLACALPVAKAWSANQQKQSPKPLPANPTTLYTPDNSQEQEQAPPPEVKTFVGKISKSGQKLILEDSAMNTSYQLDDQKKAKQYEGKSVRVIGTLDAQNNLIHVQRIEETA
jgi:hypothetical protein